MFYRKVLKSGPVLFKKFERTFNAQVQYIEFKGTEKNVHTCFFHSSVLLSVVKESSNETFGVKTFMVTTSLRQDVDVTDENLA